MSPHELMNSTLLSLRIALVATVLVAVLGIPLAFLMARLRFAGRSLLDAALTVPLVLPPTVVGFGLIVFLGRQSMRNGLLGQPCRFIPTRRPPVQCPHVSL